MLLVKTSDELLLGRPALATYSNLEDQLLVVVGGLQGVQDRRQLGSVELDCGIISCLLNTAIWRSASEYKKKAQGFSLTVDDGTNNLELLLAANPTIESFL